MGAATIDLPTPEVAAESREALRSLEKLDRTRASENVRLRAKRDKTSVDVTIPHTAYTLLLEILGHLANGAAVTIVPITAELTTQQAADLLNVSRPHLIGLLESGAIPYHKVGTHRRIRAEDLFAYQKYQRARSRDALRELARLSQELELEK